MKRNRESECRIKLIQENHYDKECQQILDDTISKQNKRYSTAYADFRKGRTFWLDVTIGLVRGARAFAKAGVSESRAADAIRNLSEAAKAAINT